MSASVKRLKDATSNKGRGRRRRHGRSSKADDAKHSSKNGAGAGSKPRPLAPLHLLALLHNLAASNGGRRDSTTCGGFFSSSECSSRSTSFDDFGDYDGEAVDFEATDDDACEDKSATREPLGSSTSSLSSTSSWSSTDSGEWSDWEDPMWVKDDMLLHSCDRDALLAATIAAGLGETQQAGAEPRRRTNKKKNKKKKEKESRQRRKAGDIAASAISVEHTETLGPQAATAPLADVQTELATVPPQALKTDATPTEPTDHHHDDIISLKTSPQRRGDDGDDGEHQQEQTLGSLKDDADEELVWLKRIGIEALEAKTQELRLSEAEDPVTAASAAVLDLSLDSVSDLGSDTFAAVAEVKPSEEAMSSVLNRQREEEWREAVALNQRLLHSDITFRLPDRQSSSWRWSPQQLSFSSSAPLPTTPCLNGGLPSPARRIPPPRPPRPPYREFAPMASADAIPVARRWPPTPSATSADEAEPVKLSGSGSRTRDMQIIREMIEEQLKQATQKRSASQRLKQLTGRPVVKTVLGKTERTTTSTATKTTNGATKPTRANKKAKEDGGSQGKRKKLKRKTKQWLSLGRHKEKTTGGGDDDAGDSAASENVGSAITALASVLNSTTIPTRRKETMKDDDDDDVPKEKEAEMDTSEKDRQPAQLGANERLMKIPILDLTVVEKPDVKDRTSPKPTTLPLTSSSSLPALSMSAAATPCSSVGDASPRHQATPTGAATHRPRNVSDPTGGSSDPLSPRRVWQAVTTPVTAASSRLRQRQSRRFDHNPLSTDSLEWVASPLVGLLRQRRQQHRDKCRSLHLPESPVAAQDDHHSEETAIDKTPEPCTENRGQHLPEADAENDAQNASSSSSGEAKATSDKKPRRKRSASVRERRPGTLAGRTLHAAA